MRISRKTLIAWFRAHQTPQAVKESVRERELQKRIDKRESGRDITVKPVERPSRAERKRLRKSNQEELESLEVDEIIN